MSHVKSQVRDAIVTALGGITALSGRVHANRVNPVQHGDMPVALVFVTEEEITTDTIGHPRHQTRAISVMVDLLVETTEDFDDDLDDLQVSVETVLGGSAFLATMNSAKWRDLTLVATEKALNGEGQVTVAGLRMEYRVECATRENNPETLI